MGYFLSHCHCYRNLRKAKAYIKKNIPIESQDFSDKCKSLKHYENSPYIIYNNILLQQNHVNIANMPYVRLSTNRVPYLDTILANLEQMFPMELLSEVDIFDNRLWDDTADVDEVHEGDDLKLKKLCQFYGLRYTRKVFQSWIQLIKDLFSNGYPWCEIKGSYPSSFWMNILSRSTEYNIEPVLDRLIRSVVVTPMGQV